MYVTTTNDLNVHIGGRTYDDVGSTIGNAYTALTGDNRGAAAGRVIDSLTKDVTIDLDEGSIRRSR